MIGVLFGAGAGGTGLALEGIDSIHHGTGIQTGLVHIFGIAHQNPQRGASELQVGRKVGKGSQVAGGIGNDFKHKQELLLMYQINTSNLIDYIIARMPSKNKL